MQDARSTETRDVSRIDIGQESEVRYWMQALGASAKDIKRAVRLVGCNLDKVREHLRLNRGRRHAAH
jgi:Protein of unknown function (DUF3606)